MTRTPPRVVMIADDGAPVIAPQELPLAGPPGADPATESGTSSAWRQTLERAMALAPLHQVYAVVDGRHDKWWRRTACPLPPHNIRRQPHGGSCAAVILLSLATILQTDPDADILIMPSNQRVRLEPILLDSLRLALDLLPRLDRRVVLLATDPAFPDPRRDYVLPAASFIRDALPVDVVRFVAKPAASVAERLISRGALWNTSILAARGSDLLRLFEHRIPELVGGLRPFLADRAGDAPQFTARRALYRELRNVSFAKDILQAQPDSLKVLRVPACTWMDGLAVDRPAPRPGAHDFMAGGKKSGATLSTTAN